MGSSPSQAGTAAIFPQSHIAELHTENIRVRAPNFHFGSEVTTDLAVGVASGHFISLPQTLPQPVVSTPPKKRQWYQKCFDVIKTTFQ